MSIAVIYHGTVYACELGQKNLKLDLHTCIRMFDGIQSAFITTEVCGTSTFYSCLD